MDLFDQFRLQPICPDCHARISVNAKGRIESHQRSLCQGSHMEWSSCKMGDKPHPLLASMSGIMDMMLWMDALIGMAKGIKGK